MIWRNALREGTGRVTAALSAGLLLLLGVTIVLFNEQAYNQQKQRELGVQAQIVSASVAPALIFLDNQSAAQYLSALSANPSIAAAAVYDASGRQVAHYSRDGEIAAPAQASVQTPRFEGRSIIVVTPVQQGSEMLGAVYLRTDAETAVQRFARYAGLGILILLATLVLAVFGLAQAALREANTELRAEIESRARAEEELLQMRKMEAIGQLVGGVAHDFNNLLTVVLSGLRLMERNPDPQRRATTAEAMRQAVERGAGLTRQLLAFARRQTLTPEVIDLGARLLGMRELLERTLRADILVDIHVAPDLWPVKSDPTQLELAIINLAVNARDAMPKGGVLTITAENLSGGAQDFVSVSVRDTGFGMTEDVRKRVFEPYFTTKQAGQGTGLGLAQVYGIVTQGGGTLRVDSAPNAGATITMQLPRSLEPVAAPVAPQNVAPGREHLAGKHLLVVEDDEGVANVVEGLARDAGCIPTRAANARAALTILEAGQKFDLIFSDIVMPGEMNGVELAQAIEERFPGTPIVLTTGYSGTANVGARYPLLRKPYDPEEFERLLATIIAGQRQPASQTAH